MRTVPGLQQAALSLTASAVPEQVGHHRNAPIPCSMSLPIVLIVTG
jgi:hypothetical protein